ncbi:prolyl oligopeptidase family serine peptidase [Streptomyces sp. TRM43335]|uniref:Prolyl oligopeptidase family serine peptidase n=1 Tax=Streptomyces taklimakanensis TaxID=2569853 RepID=A0A6G2BBE6_9ACTN|nr:alpha/beta fold hydrolase [Streptomyces taklimakanensis]MTE19544.1 prolyl oligopeptidase family serine peptidase [Streptomyces taklimakanensis]
MGHPHRHLRTSAAVVASAAVLAGTVVGPSSAAHASTDATAAPTTVRFVDIPGHGGTRLAANVVAPGDVGGAAPGDVGGVAPGDVGGGADGGRRYPLVVLPTSWSMPQVEYLAQARRFAESGYVVVSYNSRGFLQSGGEIEVAGPPDVADASRVIDWALANTPADPDRVGMAGISYGAGISLLASAHDERIKAVVAMSGWADLVGSIYSGRTQHTQAAAFLTGTGYLTGRPSDEFREIITGFLGSDLEKEGEMIEWGKKRSPATYLDRINANGAAIMLGNAWGDSIFPPNQYADFYEKLTVPKRLEFRPGDHATADLTGLLGLPNDVWNSAERWLDHHLKGEDNGIDREAPVHLDVRAGGKESHPSWKAVSSGTERIALNDTERILTGLDSGANGGTVMLTGLLDQFLSLPPTVSVPLLPDWYSAAWTSRRYAEEQRIRGTVKLRTTVTSNRSSGTFVAHLYDVNALGVGKLVTHAPFSFHDKEPGEPFAVDLELFSTAYDVPAGHRLALVVDTVDPLYAEHNPLGARLTFSSPAGSPSHVEVPVRDSTARR